MQRNNSKVPLSVFYIVKNAENKLAESLASVAWADEIVVVDSGSTDRTLDIAKQSGAKVLHHDWEGYGQQKRFAEDQCSYDWVLNLDGDEVLSDELANEIQNLNLTDGDIAFNMRWKDFWFTRFGHSFQRSKRRVRLYDRTKVRFRNHPSHDSVIVSKEKVKELNGVMLHFSYPSIREAVDKINSYTELTAGLKETRPSLFSIASVFPLTFLKAYFLRRYFLCGTDGLVISIIYAFQRFLRLAKAWESAHKSHKTPP
jgi:glycosyltransferase involved in cell wall biosynthesis